MKNYKQIIDTAGASIPHKTIRGLRLAIQRNSVKPGTFSCLTPSGGVHTWVVESTSTHVTAGYTKGKTKYGKNINKPNIRARRA